MKLVNQKIVIIKAWLILSLCLSLTNCKKLVEVNPPEDRTTGANVYNDPISAAGAVTNIYMTMQNNTFFSISTYPGITLGLSSDELKTVNFFDTKFDTAYKNSLLANNAPPIWTQLYNVLYQANSAIEGITTSKLPQALKNQLIGESLFIRGFCYFYLVNIYGDVPLLLSSDYRLNATAGRTPKDKVFFQIVDDLTKSAGMLSEGYLSASNASSNERVRPNKYAANALLARVYLFMKDWSNAEAQATLVINNHQYNLASDLDYVFVKQSAEAIWQLQPVTSGRNTWDGSAFIPTSGSSSFTRPVALSRYLWSSFEPNDQRYIKWVGKMNSGGIDYYYPFKYKIRLGTGSITEYHMVLRLAEQFLIRAEARAQLDNIIGAKQDLNIIRSRAGLSAFAIDNKTSLLNAILQERKVELFSEWGHRWLDLKRTGYIDSVMSIVALDKGVTWNSDKSLYPIPLNDLLNDSNLIQNPGY